MTVKIIGTVIVLATIAVLVVDASAAYRRRERLSSLANGAARAAADEIEHEQGDMGDLGERGAVDPARVRALVGAYLSSVGAKQRYPRLSWAVVVSGDRVIVRVTVPLELPLPLPGVAGKPQVSAESASVVPTND